MAADSSERFVLLNHLAEEFAARFRRGERPSLQEYVDRHPELADDIREFLPAIGEMEQVKDDRQELSEPAGQGKLPVPERPGDFRILREIGRGAWASSTKPSKSPRAGASRSRCSSGGCCSTPG